MALSANTVWELEFNGNDSNGGGFVAGATGTDYSQQTTAQVAYTDLVIGATTTQLTSAANPFTSAHVGNIIQIASGTGFTTGFYQVVSVASSVATMDRSVGTASSTSGVGKLGGALATWNKLSTSMVASNMAFVKADGNYTTSFGATFSINITPSPTIPFIRIRGYGVTRGDNGQPSLKLLGNNNTVLTFGTGYEIENIAVDCNSLPTSTGFSISANCSLYNCKISNWGTAGVSAAGIADTIHGCEFTGGISTATAAIVSTFGQCDISANTFHDFPGGHGVLMGNGGLAVIERNIFYNITGASADGINDYYGSTIRNNTFYNVGRHGINSSNTLLSRRNVRGNILSTTGGYGIVLTTAAGAPALPYYDGNAFYSNTLGARSNMDDTGAINPINSVVPYSNIKDIILTGDPFINAAAGDFRLNANPGAGLACRAASPPKTWPGLAITAYTDMGAIQHQDSPSGGLLVHPGMSGGMRG